MANRFEIDSIVEWSSQANGTMKAKRGKVVCVVPKKVKPLDALNQIHPLGFPYKSHVDPRSYSRNHESYLVAVPTKKGRGRLRLYWPRVSQLRQVDDAALALATGGEEKDGR